MIPNEAIQYFFINNQKGGKERGATLYSLNLKRGKRQKGGSTRGKGSLYYYYFTAISAKKKKGVRVRRRPFFHVYFKQARCRLFPFL
jgi:hypothetical protein